MKCSKCGWQLSWETAKQHVEQCTGHPTYEEASRQPGDIVTVGSKELLSAAAACRAVEQSMARTFEHIAPRYGREEAEKYFQDRAALIRAQSILINRAELEEAQGR